MQIITRINSHVILEIADQTELLGSNTKVIKDGGVYFIGFDVNVYDVADIPANVKVDTHCYDGAEFTINPEYVIPYDMETLITENADLKTRVGKLELDNINLQDALIELANAMEGGTV